MKLAAIYGTVWFVGLSFVSAQTFTSTPARPVMTPGNPQVQTQPKSAEILQLQALTKKIDEQNAKIDILSQQLFKLEQQLAHTRPGIMIGEAERSPAAAAPVQTPVARQPGITTHTVARGETLTSIAKVYGVTIGELQRFNRIEDPLKLRAGQSLMIPPVSTSPAASPAE